MIISFLWVSVLWPTVWLLKGRCLTKFGIRIHIWLFFWSILLVVRDYVTAKLMIFSRIDSKLGKTKWKLLQIEKIQKILAWQDPFPNTAMIILIRSKCRESHSTMSSANSFEKWHKTSVTELHAGLLLMSTGPSVSCCCTTTRHCRPCKSLKGSGVRQWSWCNMGFLSNHVKMHFFGWSHWFFSLFQCVIYRMWALL